MTLTKYFFLFGLMHARIFTETRSIEVNILVLFTDTEVNILVLFTDTEVNNCSSIYHSKTKMTMTKQNDQKTTKIFFKTICITAFIIVVNKTVFTRF